MNDGTAGADQGKLIFAFDSAYGAARIRAVMRNQAQAGIVLGMALLGEQRLWQRTGADIMTLAEEAVQAFDITQGGGGGLDFSVLEAFIGLMSDFVPAPIAGILTKGSDALSLVEAVAPPEQAPDPHPDIKSGTADQTYTSMCDAIAKLDTTVFNQEVALIATLDGLLDDMRTMKGTQFHINPGAGVDPDLASAKTIDVHPEYLKEIGYRTVPNIAAVTGRSSQDADAADKAGIWQRGGYLGYAPSGPYDKWSEALAQFDAVTTGSAKELVEAGALLARGAGFLRDSEDDTQQALKGVQSQINRGKDGWDNPKVGVPPPTQVKLPSGTWIPI